MEHDNPAPGHTEELNGARILVIDDTPSNIALLFEYLKAYDVEVLVTQDGASGIELAESEQPDVILLDIMMPGMDGFETCEQLKQNPRTRDIPILFLSALTETVDKVRGFRAGGVDYLTKPVEKEEMVARLRAHLTIRNQRRSLMRFFSIVSHDLRAPFNSLITATKYVAENVESFGPEQLKGVMTSLYESSSRTLKFAENLLTWARLQNQSLQPREQRIAVAEVAHDVVSLLGPEARAKEIELVDETDRSVVWADTDMLHLIIRNLVSNAIKFTPRGGRVTVASSPENGSVKISIADTGVGIPPEAVHDIFNIHRKTTSLGTEQEKGSGLGLLLCKEMVERSRGTIHVTSTTGVGSTFTVMLPEEG